jgi:outer membrane autotransporter protein
LQVRRRSRPCGKASRRTTPRRAEGHRLAPGNSIDTLNINGDLTFDPGARFEVEVNNSKSDQANVDGTATLGGTVHVSNLGIQTIKSYTILTANGGIFDTFDEVEFLGFNFMFVDPQLTYGDSEVMLTFGRNGVAFCDVARTTNQCATANALDSLGAESEVFKAVASLTNEEDARAAFDSLSGEIHASLTGQLVNQSYFVRAAILARLWQAFQSGGSGTTNMASAPLTTTPMMALGLGSGDTVPVSNSSLAVWAHGFGSWGTFEGNGNAASLDATTGGFLTGMDGLMTDQVRLGLLAGYSHSSFDADARASSGSAENYHLGLYAGTQWGDLGLRAGLAYTWSDIETNRAVIIPTLTNRLNADYDAGTFQAFGELGYRLKTAAGTFEPFANLAYVSLETDDFTEEGGATALHGHGTTTDVTFATVGLHAATHFDLGSSRLTFEGTLGWRHAFGDTLPTASLSFAGSDTFTIAGVPIAEDAAIIEAGVGLEFAPNATLGLAYQGQIAEDSAQHGVKGDLTIRF